MDAHYHRRLPHYHRPDSLLPLTDRLLDSVPQSVMRELMWAYHQASRPLPEGSPETEADRAQRELAAGRAYFAALEKQLEYGAYGPTWLGMPAAQQQVLESLRFQGGQGHYMLLAACVMPNHLHVILRLPAQLGRPFAETWGKFKSFTAKAINQLLGRSGGVWAPESFDRQIRGGSAHLERAVAYVCHNPVKAGLCADWRNWPGTWGAPELVGTV